MSFGSPVRNGLGIGLTPSTALSSGRIGGRPAMLLNFVGAPLDSRITFSRGSNATLVDSTGKITYAPANLLLQSQTFENIAWASIPSAGTGLAPVVTTDAGIAPDGTATADRVQFSLAGGTATGDVSRLRQAVTTVAAQYIFSFWVKSFDGISTYDMTADDANGAANPVAVTGEWQRFSVKATYAAGAIGVALGLRGARTLANSNTADVLVWGAQLEPVTYQTTPSTYVATTTAAYYGPRFDYDPVTLAAKGLLIEEQRTNLVLYSEQFNNAIWSAGTLTIATNTTVSPDGTSSADTGTRPTTGATENMRRATTAQAVNTAVTLTVYVKANTAGARLYMRNLAVDNTVTTGVVQFNPADGTISLTYGSAYVGKATMTAAGNGWYRCSITGTTAAVIATNFIDIGVTDGTSAVGGVAGNSIFIWGAQLEAGAFATSYIPTVASQVTRSADVATMTGTNYSSWYNPSEGTLVAEFTFLPRTLSGTAVIAYNGSANGRWSYLFNASARMFDGTNTAAAGNIATPTAVNKTASALSSAGMAISLNGAAAVTSAYVGTFGPQDALNIGSQSGAASINGHIRQIAYYNTRLPDATLQALTA